MTEEQARSQVADVGREQIAKVYAKALLGAVPSDAELRDVLDEYRSFLKDVLVQNPDLHAMLVSPRLSPDEKSGILDRVLGGRAKPEFLKFLQVVCRHNRLDCLHEIYRAAQQMFHEARGIVEVRITTATPLDGSLLDRIRTSLASQLKREVELDAQVDPRLIGGIVVRVGDTVHDASIAQQLESMRKAAVERAAQQMKQSAERFIGLAE